MESVNLVEKGLYVHKYRCICFVHENNTNIGNRSQQSFSSHFSVLPELFAMSCFLQAFFHAICLYFMSLSYIFVSCIYRMFLSHIFVSCLCTCLCLTFLSHVFVRYLFQNWKLRNFQPLSVSNSCMKCADLSSSCRRNIQRWLHRKGTGKIEYQRSQRNKQKCARTITVIK